MFESKVLFFNYKVQTCTSGVDQKIEYVHCNPVAAGIVEKPEEYIYSSARDYCGTGGLLDVTLLY